MAWWGERGERGKAEEGVELVDSGARGGEGVPYPNPTPLSFLLVKKYWGITWMNVKITKGKMDIYTNY